MSQLTGGQTILVGGQTHGFVCPPTKKFVLNAVSTARHENRVRLVDVPGLYVDDPLETNLVTVTLQ